MSDEQTLGEEIVEGLRELSSTITKGEYGEPWVREDQFLLEKSGQLIADWVGTSEQQARAVACVNALAGLNPEAVGELVEAAKGIVGNAKFQRGPGGRICSPYLALSSITLGILEVAIAAIEGDTETAEELRSEIVQADAGDVHQAEWLRKQAIAKVEGGRC